MDHNLRWVAPFSVVLLFVGIFLLATFDEQTPVDRLASPPDLAVTTTEARVYPQHGPVPGPTITASPTTVAVPGPGTFVALTGRTTSSGCGGGSRQYPSVPELPAHELPTVSRIEIPSWTATPAGRWLRDRLVDAGFDPLPVGSAFVIDHGINGVVYAWLGPEDDMGPIVSATETIPGFLGAQSSNTTYVASNGSRRRALVDTTVAGGVRLWFLTQPRDEWDSTAALPAEPPCLPGELLLRRRLLEVAAAAEAAPFSATVPSTAGEFGLQWHRNLVRRHREWLEMVGLVAYGRALPQPGALHSLPGYDSDEGFTPWLTSYIAPHDTDPRRLVSIAQTPRRVDQLTVSPDTLLATSPTDLEEYRVRAGGRELAVFFQIEGGDQREAVTALLPLAVAANRHPFLGQPYMDAEAAGLVISGIFANTAARPYEWWLVIRNTSGTAVDMTGWALRDDASPTHFFPFPDGFVLAADASVTLVYGPKEGTCEADTATTLHWCNRQRPEGGTWHPFLETILLYDAEERRAAAQLGQTVGDH